MNSNPLFTSPVFDWPQQRPSRTPCVDYLGLYSWFCHGVNWISITSEAPCNQTGLELLEWGVIRRTVKQAVLTNTEKQSSWPQLICAICDSCRSETVGAREDSLWPLWVQKEKSFRLLKLFFSHCPAVCLFISSHALELVLHNSNLVFRWG